MEPNNTNYSNEPQLSNNSSMQNISKNKKRRTIVTLAIALFVVLIAGMFLFAFLWQNDDSEEVVNEDDTTEQEEGPYADITRIDAKHFYEDGTHTLVGEVAMPTPCDLLQADALVAESMPEQVTIDFTVTNEAEFCAQVVTPQRFRVDVDASEDATFSARLEGRSVELNLLDPEPGETPEDFELYIKG